MTAIVPGMPAGRDRARDPMPALVPPPLFYGIALAIPSGGGGGRRNRHLEHFNVHSNGGFSGLGSISALVHVNSICAVWCNCTDCISGNPCIHASCSLLAISAMSIDHIGTFPAGTAVNVTCSESTVVLAQIQGPSERGADHQTIAYVRCGDA